jgi:PAS domain S-box-containing protein
MKLKPVLGRTGGPFAIAFVYAVFGAIWIAFSDEFVAHTFQDPVTVKHVSMYKGWCYVAVTAVLVYMLVKNMERSLTSYLKDIAQANDELQEQVESRRDVEQSLQEAQRKLSTLFNNIPDRIVRFDSDLRLAFVNPAAAKTFGVPAESILGKTMSETHAPGDDAQNAVLEDMIRKAMTEGVPNIVEARWQTVDGIRFFDILHVPERDESGKVVSVLGIAHDVTERKEAEAALWQSSQMLRLVLENMPAFVFWKDRNSVYLGCNKLFAANAGLSSPDRIVGMTDLDLPWKLTEAESYRADDRMVMTTDTPKLNYEETQHTADGRVTWVRTSKIPLKNPQGEIIGVLGTFEDITDRKAAEMQREVLMHELSEKNNELKSIVYISSHDLRSPIVNVLGFLSQATDSVNEIRVTLAGQTLAEDTRRQLDRVLGEELPEALGFIKSAAEKMSALVGALLKVSRIGALTLTVVAIDANRLVRRLISAMQYQLRQREADITVDDLPACKADEIQLSQVFSNLIDNALKYTPLQKRPCIRISGRREGKEAIYAVSDNGIGIPPAYHTKVFELFHRLNPDDASSGEGVGLTIVNNIVMRHHGRVWLESKPGEGSTFYFALPAA